MNAGRGRPAARPLVIGSALSKPVAGRLPGRVGSRRLVQAGAVLALLSAFAFTRIGAGTSEVWPAIAAFPIGVGLGAVGAPTIPSLHRTLPGYLSRREVRCSPRSTSSGPRSASRSSRS
ncbi:hypothetical protein [Streptomyces sp. OR43]|uniref:hypothetical protein n=1 Tax=Streptomyces sp. or43 TaxID=2478957 RepID=UPI0021C71484|nr:hypothetical protein [Streptomyces sp. or43]